MFKKIAYWLVIGFILIVVDTQAYAEVSHHYDGQQAQTESNYSIDIASDDLSSQINFIQPCEFECRLFQEDRKIQQKTTCGIRFIRVAQYHRQINQTNERVVSQLLPCDLFHSLTFIRKIQR